MHIRNAFRWMFNNSRKFFSSPLGKAIIAILSIFGISVGTKGAVDAGKAIKLNRRSQKIRDDALQLHEEHYQKVQSALEVAGKTKLAAIDSFDDFADQMAKIQDRPEFSTIECKGVELPTFTADDLKIISNNVALAIEGVAYAGAGAGLGIAVCGLNVLALGPGMFIGGIGLLVAGGRIKKKAVANQKQAKQLAQDVDTIIKQYDELAEAATFLEKHISSVYSQYEKQMSKMKEILSKKTVWGTMSKREQTTIENVILLVGMLFKLCKIELIVKKNKAEIICSEEIKNIGTEVDAVLKRTRPWWQIA